MILILNDSDGNIMAAMSGLIGNVNPSTQLEGQNLLRIMIAVELTVQFRHPRLVPCLVLAHLHHHRHQVWGHSILIREFN